MEENKALTGEELERLGTEALRQRLLEETGKNLCDIDGDAVRAVLMELESRGKDPALTDDAHVRRACRQYREAVGGRRHKRCGYRGWLVTAASVVLVLGLLLFALPGTASAGKLGAVLAGWTDSIFQFFTPGEPAYSTEEYIFRTDNPGLQQIYDAATELGITEPVVPMWLPEGFELEELNVFQFADEFSLSATLGSEDKYVFIVICKNNTASFQHEKNTQRIKVIEVANIDHYLISNTENDIVTWMTGNMECSITTDCREENIYRILNSIYVPEG